MSDEKKRYSLKDYKEQVEKIEQLTIELKAVVDTMPSCSAKKAYENSVVNLEKKNEKYNRVAVSITPEEKEVMKNALKEFREKKKISEVSAESVKNAEAVKSKRRH